MCLFLRPAVYLTVSVLCASLSVCLSACLPACLPVCLSARLSVSLSVGLFVCLFVSLLLKTACICPSLCVSAGLCPSLCKLLNSFVCASLYVASVYARGLQSNDCNTYQACCSELASNRCKMSTFNGGGESWSQKHT